jgi:mono/diheme cytochrome c family protein
MYRPKLWAILVLNLVLLPSVLSTAFQKRDKTTSSLRSSVEGAELFQYRCAMCHGADGRGHGPDEVVLKRPLPDLTLISRRTGGNFPYQRVKEIIEGRETGRDAHGNREMPAWGPIFHEVEADQDWGEVRLDAITRHVQSIQQK